MTRETCELIGGPQDGGKVRVPSKHPKEIFVGPKWLGDGFVAWGDPGERFPIRYVLGADCYHYSPKETP